MVWGENPSKEVRVVEREGHRNLLDYPSSLSWRSDVKYEEKRSCSW